MLYRIIAECTENNGGKPKLFNDPGGEQPKPEDPVKPKHYPLFDYLRLWLAAAVLAIHAYARGKWGNYDWHSLAFILPMVPTFLAISGFLVLQSFENSRSWLHFAWKRALRIIPALSLCFAVSGVVWGWPDGAIGAIREYLGGGWLLGANSNGALWSLMWEEVAYLLLAVLFLVGAYRAKWPIWTLFAISIIPAAMFGDEQTWGRGVALAPAFFAGNLLYIYREKVTGIHWAIPCLAVVTLQFVNFVCHVDSGSLLSVLVCAPCAVILGLNVKVKRLPIDLSYGLYIFHLPVLAVLSRGNLNYPTLLALGLVCTGLLATVSSFLLERPASKLKNLSLRKSSPIVKPSAT